MSRAPVIIGIGGGTASGKTTIARAVADHLGTKRATLISHDMYYRTPPAGVDLDRYNFDEPAALDNDRIAADLAALANGRSVQIPLYNFDTHLSQAGDWCSPTEYIIVEGILIFASEALRSQLQHRIYVRTPEATRLHRRLLRDQAERGRNMSEILHQYFNTVRPMHELHVRPSQRYCTSILDGESPIADSVQRVLDHISTFDNQM